MEPEQGGTSEAAVFVEVFNAAEDPAGPGKSSGSLNVLFLEKRVAALRSDLAYFRAENETLRADLRAANDRCDRLREEINNVYASGGWRLVLRLRRLRDFFRRLAAAFRPPAPPPACEERP